MCGLDAVAAPDGVEDPAQLPLHAPPHQRGRGGCTRGHNLVDSLRIRNQLFFNADPDPAILNCGVTL